MKRVIRALALFLCAAIMGEIWGYASNVQARLHVLGAHRYAADYQERGAWAGVQQFIQDHVRFRISPASNFLGARNNHTSSAWHYANFSAQDFASFFDQQIQAGTLTETQILGLYELYNNPQFLAYIKKLPGYNAHMLKLHDRLYCCDKHKKWVLSTTGFGGKTAKNFFRARANEIYLLFVLPNGGVKSTLVCRVTSRILYGARNDAENGLPLHVS